jgi:hypothetical protein
MPKETNQAKALAALIEASSVREASGKSGISEATLYRYLSEQEFYASFRLARRQIVETSIGRLQSATGEAVETLLRNLHCEQPAVEVRTAQIILETAQKGLEAIEILERLDILEKATDQRAT